MIYLLGRSARSRGARIPIAMRVPSQLYSTSLALLTDFYQLTMA
jgi:hypothetical protein